MSGKLTKVEAEALSLLGAPDTSGIGSAWLRENGYSIPAFETISAMGLAEVMRGPSGRRVWFITDLGRAALADSRQNSGVTR